MCKSWGALCKTNNICTVKLPELIYYNSGSVKINTSCVYRGQSTLINTTKLDARESLLLAQMWTVIMQTPLYTLVWIMYLSDLHWLQITDASANYGNDRTSQKKIHLKWRLMRDAKKHVLRQWHSETMAKSMRYDLLPTARAREKYFNTSVNCRSHLSVSCETIAWVFS